MVSLRPGRCGLDWFKRAAMVFMKDWGNIIEFVILGFVQPRPPETRWIRNFPNDPPKPGMRPRNFPNDHPKPGMRPRNFPNDHPKPRTGPRNFPNDPPKPGTGPRSFPNDHPKPGMGPRSFPNDPPKPGTGPRSFPNGFPKPGTRVRRFWDRFSGKKRAGRVKTENSFDTQKVFCKIGPVIQPVLLHG